MLILAAVIAAILAGCGSSPPSPEPANLSGRLPTACIGLAFAQCEQGLAALAEHLDGATPSYVAIAGRRCDGPCPGSERGAWLGHLTVEYIDGRNPHTILIAVDGASVDWDPIESVFVAVEPRSERLTGVVTPVTLGHCGLSSGIDLDGSFWDPIGAIPADHPDVINSADGTVALTSANTATLRTVNGLVVQLVRHQSPKFLLFCD